MKTITEREQWFLDRVGKRVWRNKNYCDCNTCDVVYTKGLMITDSLHAGYLWAVEGDYYREGFPLKYFDTPEERDAFELTLKK
jgi:hypothetical protein